MEERTVASPAARAISLLGAKRIAHACDLTTDAVYKWPKLRDGHIPARHQSAVLELAKRHDVTFTAEDVIGVAA